MEIQPFSDQRPNYTPKNWEHMLCGYYCLVGPNLTRCIHETTVRLAYHVSPLTVFSLVRISSPEQASLKRNFVIDLGSSDLALKAVWQNFVQSLSASISILDD
jgi:hypothetical protein